MRVGSPALLRSTASQTTASGRSRSARCRPGQSEFFRDSCTLLRSPLRGRMINPPYPDCLVGRGASACRPVQTTTKATFKDETLAQSPDIARTSLAIASSVASEPVRSMKAWHLRRPRIRSAPSSAARSLPKAVVRKQDARRLKLRRKRLLSLQSAMAAVSGNVDGIW